MTNEAFPKPLVLGDATAIRRDRVRPEKWQDSTYGEKYDDRTVFYDLIRSGDEIVAIGPPLLNLEAELTRGAVSLAGHAPKEVKTTALERSQITRFLFDGIASDSPVFTFKLQEDKEALEVVPSTEMNHLFRGKRVLMTLQKDEELEWIIDWATYYSNVHGCDAVLLYDNGSSKYQLSDLQRGLSSIPGIDRVVVVDWPFKYGPQGGAWVGNDAAWDSDFCQIGALQNARIKFLRDCEGFLNVDVDELVVSNGTTALFEFLAESPDGVVGFEGHWVANAPIGLSPGQKPRHFNFFQVEGNGKACSSKWLGTPGRWPDQAHPTAHYVRNAQAEQSPEFYLAHFKGINSAWKNKERVAELGDLSGLKIDEPLLRCLQKAFPGTISETATLNLQPANMVAAQFQRWLDREIFLSTRAEIAWKKRWTWKNTVLVFEVETPYGMVAFDIHLGGEGLRLAVNARDRNQVQNLRNALGQVESEVGPIRDKGNGFWVLGQVLEAPEYAADDKRNKARDVLVAAIRRIARSISEPVPAPVARPADPAARGLVKRPLQNLRGDDRFKQLAETVRRFSGGSRIVYVPNQGNWGDGLIHKGILQFLTTFQFDYLQMTRHDLLKQTEFVAKNGGQIEDLVLLSGGGGSWRNAGSGNRSFMATAASLFAKSVVMPHTYETGAIGGLGSGNEILYAARDDSLSLKSIPDAFVCHDMAFFLQLPELFAAPASGGTGYFLRGDPERNASAGGLPPGMDLSMQGNHLSNVTPFFQILSGFDKIVTDRMHIAIAGGMLGKQVELFPGNYGKANAVYDLSLKSNYPNVAMMSW